VADDALEIRIPGNVLAVVPNEPLRITPYVLLEQEDWFEDEIRYLRRLPWSGMRALDIGASYGLYALTLASVAGPQGHVWAIEPSPRTAGFLRRSAERNAFRQLSVHELALSHREGTATLLLGANSELNRLEGTASGTDPALDASAVVRTMTLERFASEERCADVDFIKLDVEGAELQVIEGGSRFFAAQDPLVQVEITDGNRVDVAPLRRLRALGYRTFRLATGLGLLVPVAEDEALDPDQLNLFACKDSRAARLEADGLLLRDGGRPAAGVPSVAAAVELHRVASDFARPAEQRYGALMGAHRMLEAVCVSAPTPQRLATWARIAADLGWRNKAKGIVARACAALSAGHIFAAEPFLAASPYFDGIDPSRRPFEWLQGSLLDAHARLAEYSSYFWSSDMLPMLETLKQTGYLGPAMERRRQLTRLLSGQQQGPEPSPLLMQFQADHLNPQLWGGRAPQ
jgi:protein O-GlcNAc transferase